MGALSKVKSAPSGALAEPVGEERHDQYLTFSLGGEMFAIGILSIKEIIEFGDLTEVPMMPQFIRGVISLRGAVVPVLDVSARFGRKPTEVTRRTCIVIIEVETGSDRHDLGVMVDSVSEVLEIASGEIEPAPSLGTRIRADFIHGMGKVNGKFVIILSVDNVSLDDLAPLEGAFGTDAGS
jgi:purine-binding chemotaxis protein CheW